MKTEQRLTDWLGMFIDDKLRRLIEDEKFYKVFFVPVALAVLLSAIKLKAQEAKEAKVYLFGMECRSNTPDIAEPLRQSERSKVVKFGRNHFEELAYLYNKYVIEQSGDILDNSGQPAEVICIIPPGYSKLNLEFGLDKLSKVTDREDVILLEVYKEQELVDQRYLTMSKLGQSWSVDIQNAQRLTLKADCINPNWWNNCPRLSFVDISLN